MGESDRRLGFEALVLQALWLLMLRSFGSNPKIQAVKWRTTALWYLGQTGRQGEEVAKYREEESFPELRT